jgi:hypothetical protein
MHKEQQRRTREDIANILEARHKIKEAEAKTTDDRRKVLNLKECMTCTPDMEFEITVKRPTLRTSAVV